VRWEVLMADLSEVMARPARFARPAGARRFGKAMSGLSLPSRESLTSGSAGMPGGIGKLARPSKSREAGRARQGVTRHVDLGGPISRQPKPSWLRWSFRVGPVMELARPAHQRGSENRTRQTPNVRQCASRTAPGYSTVVKILLQCATTQEPPA
jgi:hypothetical protein